MHYIGLFDTVVLMTNDVSVILYLKNIINQMSKPSNSLQEAGIALFVDPFDIFAMY